MYHSDGKVVRYIFIIFINGWCSPSDGSWVAYPSYIKKSIFLQLKNAFDNEYQ